MKILAIADRPSRRSIREIISEEQVELIVTLGDLGYFELQELEMVEGVPKIGIYGNHCSGNYFEKLGIQNAHLKIYEFGGLTFGGFEGSVRYKEGSAPMYTQEEASGLLADFPRVDVFLSHCPPFGINDDQSELAHTGFLALRKYLEEKKPKCFFHGHTYPSDSELVTRYLDTEIVYVYAERVFDVEL